MPKPRMVADSDIDIAFDLQVEEALVASLLDGAVSSPDDPVLDSALSNIIQNDNLFKYEQELRDHYMMEAETERLRLDLRRQVHDRAFACEIMNVPEETWRYKGDHLSRPYGEGSSSSNGEGSGFRIYVWSLVEGILGGIGVAVCDQDDGLVFELSKGLSGKDQQVSKEMVALKALNEGLDTALMLDVKKITIFTDNQWLFHYMSGVNPPMKENAHMLCNQINLLWRKLSQIRASLVPTKDVKFAVELARTAIAFQVNRAAGSSTTKNPTVCCTICMEDTYLDQMFLIASCQHSYCFSCMSKHVQFKLLQGILPKCPSVDCKSKLKINSCEVFLSPELLEIMRQREKEASIPPAKRIYCPYPKCSTLLSKTELKEAMGQTKCPKCSGVFCANCKVPWHKDMSCTDFRRKNPYTCNEDQNLKNLASRNLWRQCPKCNHMVSLAAGCYHIYCRCGHEFCYTCGAEWKKKKATCNCPIWDERNIVYDH